MTARHAHSRIDWINAQTDLIVASRLRRNPRVLALARRNLRRWMSRDGRKPRRTFAEWHGVLHRLSRSQIAEFLASDTPMARRLRQSSPFAGVLTERERMALWRQYDEA